MEFGNRENAWLQGAVRVKSARTPRGLSYEDAVLRIDAQPPQAHKVARADVVIDNGGTIEAIACQVKRAWAELHIA